MAIDTDQMWEEWGKHNPYYGVMSSDIYRNETVDAHRDEFFASGALHIDGVVENLQKYFGPLSFTRALDFGCGVGRLVIPLSGKYKSVTGIDISESMLAEAQKNLDDRSITNVELTLSDDKLSKLANKQFDLLHTYIVLQHIPVHRGYQIIESMLRLGTDDAAIYLHFSVRRNLTPLERMVYFAKHNIIFARFIFNILQGKRLNEPTAQMNEYDVPTIIQLLKKYGYNHTVVEHQDHGKHSTIVCFGKRNTEEDVRA